MRSAVQLSLSIASILYATVGHAIFADEAYQTDYHHALLGFPQAHATFFHRPSPASKASLLFTLSERLVLGAVNPKDGAIIWRQQLADQAQNQTAVSLLRAGEGGDTLVTAVGGVTTSWDARDGRLGWQRRGNARIKSLDITEGDRDVLIFTEGQSRNAVRRLSADTGAILWEHNDSRSAIKAVSATGKVCQANSLQRRLALRCLVFQGERILDFASFSAAKRV